MRNASSSFVELLWHDPWRPSQNIFTEEMLRDVYKVNAEVIHDRDGLPHVVAYGSLKHS